MKYNQLFSVPEEGSEGRPGSAETFLDRTRSSTDLEASALLGYSHVNRASLHGSNVSTSVSANDMKGLGSLSDALHSDTLAITVRRGNNAAPSALDSIQETPSADTLVCPLRTQFEEPHQPSRMAMVPQEPSFRAIAHRSTASIVP